MQATRHTLKIVKFLMPTLSLGLLAVTLFLTMSDRGVSMTRGFRIFSGNQAKVIRYTGFDNKGQPFVLTAPETHELSNNNLQLKDPMMELILDSGEKIVMRGDEAIYNQDAQTLAITGHVNVKHSKGYEFNTKVASIYFDQSNKDTL
jgi:hypothetical protein